MWWGVVGCGGGLLLFLSPPPPPPNPPSDSESSPPPGPAPYTPTHVPAPPPLSTGAAVPEPRRRVRGHPWPGLPHAVHTECGAAAGHMRGPGPLEQGCRRWLRGRPAEQGGCVVRSVRRVGCVVQAAACTPPPPPPHPLPDGSFAGDSWGEVDTRFSYCALSCCALLGRLDALDVPAAVAFILTCRNFDGGFGCVPGAESHAGQVFCCIGALSIAGE